MSATQQPTDKQVEFCRTLRQQLIDGTLRPYGVGTGRPERALEAVLTLVLAEAIPTGTAGEVSAAIDALKAGVSGVQGYWRDPARRPVANALIGRVVARYGQRGEQLDAAAFAADCKRSYDGVLVEGEDGRLSRRYDGFASVLARWVAPLLIEEPA